MKLYELFIALRYMTANIKQSFIIALAVGIGVSIIIFVPSVNLSFFNDLIDKTVSSSYNVYLTKELETFNRDTKLINREFKNNIVVKDKTLTRRRNISSYKSIIKSIIPISEIVAAAPYASGQGIAVRGAGERGVNIKGIISEQETKVVDIKKDMIEGSIDKLSINDIVIGKILGEKLNVGLGDRISITGPRGMTKTFKIKGIFSTGLRGQDEGQIYTNLKSAQQLLILGNEVSGIGIRIKDIYQADNIARKLEPLTGLTAKSWMEDNKQIIEQISRFRLIIAFINFLIIFAAASSITSVFILLIASKSKEIGILKSMGAKNTSVMFIFLSQAVILSVIGYFAGLVGAKLLISWYSYMLSSATETFLTTSIPVLKINFQYALLALFYSMVTSLIASIIPAWQAAKLNPVEAINA